MKYFTMRSRNNEQKLANIPKTPQELAEAFDQALFELATSDLHEFVQQAWHLVEPGHDFVDNWHVRAICSHLTAVADGRIANLIINVPPGTMKSLLVCVFFPAWLWATRPHERFMCASYSGSQSSPSMRDSVRCRTIIESQWFQERWGVQLKDDQNAKGLYENDGGGWRMATSVGGAGTGLHPSFIIVDDPHKVSEAESDAERQSVIDWWDGTMSTRGVTQSVRRICIMQRVHTGDLAGHLLSKGNWTHLCLPMRYEEPGKKVVDGEEITVPRMPPTPIGFTDPRTQDGELLWPALFTDEVVATLETDLGLYHAAGQLQQRPAPRGGGKFKREWFQVIQALPDVRRLVRYWDKAGSVGNGAQTAGVLMGEYRDEATGIESMRTKYVIIDIVRGRWEAADREAVLKQTAETDRAKYGHVDIWTEQEPGSGGKESAHGTVSNLVGFNVQSERVTGSKEVRADPLASQASVGKVKLLAGSWTAQFLDEAEAFPNGKLKDFIDGASGAFNKLHAPGTGLRSADEFRSRPSESIADSGKLSAHDF